MLRGTLAPVLGKRPLFKSRIVFFLGHSFAGRRSGLLLAP